MSKDEHVPEVKHLICTTKERCRCSFCNTPFKKLPRGLTIGLLKNVMFYLNAFLHKDVVSQDLSPYTIVQGKVVDYNLHCTVAFGSYAQTRNLTTNDMCMRTTGAIAICPSTNFQGGVKFYSLKLAKTTCLKANCLGQFSVAPK